MMHDGEYTQTEIPLPQQIRNESGAASEGDKVVIKRWKRPQQAGEIRCKVVCTHTHMHKHSIVFFLRIKLADRSQDTMNAYSRG